MSSGRRITRRRFLQVSAGTGFSVLTLANGHKVVAQSATPEAAAVTASAEAPMLTEMVNAGTLPPLAERAPSVPLVVNPVESVGTYGGTWRTAALGGADQHVFQRLAGYDNLVIWSTDWNEVVPNVAQAYEVNEDFSEYTFTLRPGHKWSDGAPFTSEDIAFYGNDVTTSAAGLGQGNFPYVVEVIDEITFTVKFEKPNGLFLQTLCQMDGRLWTQAPKHYMSQFHEKFNTTNLDELVAEAGAADWIELFRTKGGSIPGLPNEAMWTNPELPRLGGWQLVEPYGTGTRVTMTRNPYYFKVDPEGQQLPYIDTLNYEVTEDVQVLLLKALNGELDMHLRHFCTLRNKPVIAEALPAMESEFFDVNPSIMNTNIYMLNLAHKNPALREIFQNKDFRIGLSHAINRQNVIDVVYVSQGEPWQAAPRKETPYYSETLAKQYTEYDVDLANEYLDKVLPNKDSDGWRLRPDGERLSFVVEVAQAGEFPEMVDASTLVVEDWRKVGVDVQASVQDRTLFQSRCDANDHDAAVWPGGSGLQDSLISPYNYMAFSGNRFGIPWTYYWTKPAEPLAEPEEGPEPIVQQQALYDQIRATGDPDEQIELLKQILAIAEEQFWVIGISLPAPEYGIKKTNFRNVRMQGMPQAWVYPNPGPDHPAHFYFDV
jgi:peptide/nickel transport system substrate-binding protein